jgi:metal-responsive CopG/Arc/MetJ family transcriptional regulator
MSKKVSITLDDEILNFVDQRSNNRSSFINRILWEEKKRIFLQDLANAYEEQAKDLEFFEEIAAWDTTVGDGLGA